MIRLCNNWKDKDYNCLVDFNNKNHLQISTMLNVVYLMAQMVLI